MKYIEMKSEGYTLRYDFKPIPTTEETFDPTQVVYEEDRSNVDICLSISLDLLRAIFGRNKVKEALQNLREADY